MFAPRLGPSQQVRLSAVIYRGQLHTRDLANLRFRPVSDLRRLAPVCQRKILSQVSKVFDIRNVTTRSQRHS